MRKIFTQYSDVSDFLDALGLFHMDLTLERMYNVLEKLNLTRPNFYVVQVVGTNGKGSTSTFLEWLAREHGVRTGLFTSPHFASPLERIRINGKPLPEENWPALAQKIHDAAPELTYFEFLTVLAVLAFAEHGVDCAIMEAGLGGHYDATTALTRDALCYTPISMDHENVLGATLLAIAADKAEAIAEQMPVFSAQQEPEVLALLQKTCTQRSAILFQNFIELQNDIQNYPLGLQGVHQVANAALALKAWQYISHKNHWSYDEAKIRTALEQAFIAGRLQSIHCDDPALPPELLLDGAHNAHGLQSFLEYMEKQEKKPAVIIFSCLADKNQAQLLQLLRRLQDLCAPCLFLIPTIQDNARALMGEEKAAFAKALSASDGNVCCEETVFDALTTARNFVLEKNYLDAPVVLCGSLYLLGEFYTNYPQYLYK